MTAPTPDQLIAALPGALILIDDAGQVVRINGAAEMQLNRGAAQIVGKPLSELLVLPASGWAAMRADAPFTAYDCEIARKGGPTRRVDLTISPLPDHPGWHLMTLAPSAQAGTIGERRSLARSATGVAAMLAHEIKNPLSGIRGAAQLLEKQIAKETLPLTDLIKQEVDRVTALIDRMEQFTDDRPLVRQSENIYAIIDHAVGVARSGFGASAHISDAFDPSLPAVLVHRDSLIQILLNLLKNACEAAEEGVAPSILIATRYRHGVVLPGEGGARLSVPIELSVSDFGPGPAPELIDHLFEPFVSSKPSGRGLGLALVDKLVRDNGGIIQFARDGHPPRTTFRILLPRAP